MAIKILMPKLGLTMKTGTVLRWLKNEGDMVLEQEAVMEIETEKLSHTVESPGEGILLKKLAREGEKYPIAQVLGYIGQPGEALPDGGDGTEALTVPAESDAQYAAARETGGRIFISPVAKKLAAQLGLDYTKIAGTGPNGRIVKADVLDFSEEPSEVRPLEPEPCIADLSGEPVIPYAGLRRAIGENMYRAWSSIPMVTHQVAAEVSALLELREMLNNGVSEKSERVSINDLILKLTAAALTKTPVMNASLTEAGIVCHKRVNLGMATAIPGGLVVPVLCDADRKSLLDLSREAKELALRARNGGLKPDDLHGATFTVSNLGAYGSVDYFTPIINPPEAGILGVGRVTERVIPVNGEIVIRPMMGLSLTYDHRIVDGAVAAEFIAALLTLLKNPARSIL